jgi:hypothetical protein
MKSLELVFDLVRFMLSVVVAIFLTAIVLTGVLWAGLFINNILIWVLN